jgi:hypothetical protein
MSTLSPTISQQTIPGRLVIGVTGHRKLHNEQALIPVIDAAIRHIIAKAPKAKNADVIPSILSPLAEGADRLVARRVLENFGGQLEAVLPMEEEEYIKDFESASSRQEFSFLLSKCHTFKELKTTVGRPGVYERTGRYVVDNCDVLIVIWNGKPAKGIGGTEAIYRYALKKGRFVALIRVQEDNDSVRSEYIGKGIDPKLFDQLNAYNSHKVGEKAFQRWIDNNWNSHLSKVKSDDFPTEKLHAILNLILPHFARSDILAEKFQGRYFNIVRLIFLLAAAAIGVGATQIIFLTNLNLLNMAEAVLMFVLLASALYARIGGLQTKWIDYRFLAERFRSSIFVALVDKRIAAELTPPRHLSLGYSSNYWMGAAFSTVWQTLDNINLVDESRMGVVKQYLLDAWINDQKAWHLKNAKSHDGLHRIFEYTGYVLFASAFVVAVVAAFGISGRWNPFLSIVLPAVAGSLGAISIQREYNRNALRSYEMARHLGDIGEQIEESEDLVTFKILVQEAEQTMLHENQDWRVMILFHPIEPKP